MVIGIVLDVFLVAIFALNVFFGYKKGLINVIFNIFAFFVALVITLILVKPVSSIVINNTQLDDNIKMAIINNNENNQEIVKEEDTTSWQKFIENKIQGAAEDAKNVAVEKIADVVSIKVVEIVTGLTLFAIVRIALILLKFITEAIAELPIIKQFNEIGGLLYGVLKGGIIVIFLVTIMFFVVSVNSNGIIATAVDSSYVTKILYNNNILLNIIL